MEHKKMLVTGFPHCGTTILKCLIGHIDGVFCAPNEGDEFRNDFFKKHAIAVTKYPFIKKEYFESDEYRNVIKIIIIRDPRFVYTSLNKRFGKGKINKLHDIEKYKDALNTFIYYRKNVHTNVYTITYKELLQDKEYRKFKEILDSIGLKYTNDIFDNEKYDNYVTSIKHIKNSAEPSRSNNSKFRTWQINQPLKYNDEENNIDITEAQREKINSLNYHSQVYNCNREGTKQ